MNFTDTQDIYKFVTDCVESEKDRALLLQYLIQIQQQFAYIPAQAIDSLMQLLQLDVTRIQSVISFYSFLNSSFDGSYRVLFSDNITDRMLGNQHLYSQLKDRLTGHQVFIGFTSCTGFCDQGPAMLVNGWAINKLDTTRIDAIAELILTNQPVETWPETLFSKQDNIRKRDIQLNCKTGNVDVLQLIQQKTPEQILQIIDDSGLRGRGGAGFSTAQKWSFCKQSPSTQRYVVCNADEGEPGTFKDRVLLSSYAHSVVAGMTVCAKVIGATRGLIYLRGEYRYLLKHLNEVINQRRANGLLGRNILGQDGFDFDIDIHLGAGAYICGEESALIESLEGKCGNPRVRPPFPVVEGYKNKPTVVNNVETFWSVNNILLNNADWFKQKGTELSTGTRLLSISGDCEKPGIYEFPFGISLREILVECGGLDAMAVQMAGAAGNLLLEQDFDCVMCCDGISTGGSFMVIGKQRNLMELLENFANFFRHESCGFCTPCRVGTSLIADIMQNFIKRQGCQKDIFQLREITALMKVSSFCGLGSSAPTVFIDALNKLPELFDSHMKVEPENPHFDLDAEVSDFKKIIGQQLTGGAIK